MKFTDTDLERWLRAACPPIDPAPPLRRIVLAAAPRRRPAGRMLRMFFPFAAGVLSVLAAERWGRESLPSVSDTEVRDSADVAPAAMFERIADRAPPPARAPAASGAAPAGVEYASAPVPRIS
jgi:hypothetical protein